MFSRFYRIKLLTIILELLCGQTLRADHFGSGRYFYRCGAVAFVWPPIGAAIERSRSGRLISSGCRVWYLRFYRAFAGAVLVCIISGTFLSDAESANTPTQRVIPRGGIPYMAGDPTAGMLILAASCSKMCDVPAAAIAIWHSAKPENRAKVGGIMISAALTSFLTGRRPIEFSFMFVAIL